VICRGSDGGDVVSGRGSLSGGTSGELCASLRSALGEATDCLACRRRKFAARISFCWLSCIDFVYALCIFALRSAKSTEASGTSGIFRGGCFVSLVSLGWLLRVIFIPVLTCCGDPDRSPDRSAAFCLELAVVAEETGCRDREPRRGGEVFGRGAMTCALRLAVFVFILSGVLALLRGGEVLVGVLARFVGVIERPAGLKGFCSAFRSFPLESDFCAKGEFARVEGILEESEDVLPLFDAVGSRDVSWAAADNFGRVEV